MENQIVCAIEMDSSSELRELADQIRQTLNADNQVLESQGIGFAGLGAGEIILLLSSARAISQAAKVVVAWLEARKGRVIKINKTEFKGYSVEDAMRLIEAASGESGKKKPPRGERND